MLHSISVSGCMEDGFHIVLYLCLRFLQMVVVLVEHRGRDSVRELEGEWNAIVSRHQNIGGKCEAGSRIV